MNNREKGIYGESLVEEYMKKNEYRIIEKNYRAGKNEIDIIAVKGDVIVFVEVKLRNNRLFGMGYDALNHIKKRNIVKSAMKYLLSHNYSNYNVRFDVASIDESNLVYIENAFNLNYLK